MTNINLENKAGTDKAISEFVKEYLEEQKQAKKYCKQNGHQPGIRTGDNGILANVHCPRCNIIYKDPLNQKERDWYERMKDFKFTI